MTIDAATSGEPLLHLAARLLVAAESDPRNAEAMRSTAAVLQLLTGDLGPAAVAVPAAAAVGGHGPGAKVMHAFHDGIDSGTRPAGVAGALPVCRHTLGNSWSEATI